MQPFSRPPLAKMISLRLTAEQDELLEALAQTLGLAGKSDVLRRALDYWLEHAPEAQAKGKKRKS
jgi:Arc/MetJ-type ribon-helix-helix transcriptional regulator